MKKKMRNGLLGIILVVVGLLFANSQDWAVQAEKRSGDQYVTKSWIDNSNSQTIEGNVLEIEELYTLNYEWELPDNTFKKGDELDFSIPKEFVVNDSLSFPLVQDGEEIGQVKVLGNATEGYYYHLVFTTDYVETHSNITGTFDISVSLNEKYVHENDVIEIVYPDKTVTTKVEPNPNEPGGGGNGAGAGNNVANKKTGEIDVKNLFNPKTGAFDTATRVFTWQLSLGRKTLLGKAKSFDDIEAIFVEDSLDKQKLIGMNQFDENWEDAFGWKKGFYEAAGFEYGDIPENEMGLNYKSGENYASSFKMDILPYVKEYDKKATEKNSPFEQFGLDYYSVPLNPDDAFDGENFYNKATITIRHKDKSEESWTLEDSVVWNIAGGTVNGRTAGVEFLKLADDTKEPLKGATFDLYKYNNQGVSNKVKNNLTSDKNGKVQVTGLTTGNYYFIETNPPTGYEKSDKKLAFTVETKDLSQNNQQIKYKKLDNYENHKENTKTSISVTKEWQDEDDKDGSRPSSIQVQLYANETKLGKKVTLNEANNWSYTWEDLDEKANGQLINYTVKEVKTPSGYVTSAVKNKDGNVVITNTHNPEMTAIKGTKQWNDQNNQDGKRPEAITVNLLANGIKVDEKTVTAANNWEYEFTNLKKYQNGKLINYTVTENNVPEYSTTIDGQNLINNYTPKKTSVTVTKAWDDHEDQDGKRPVSINVQLYANGKKSGESVTLNEANKWTYTWQDLDEKANGKLINYTVKEAGIPSGYKVVVNNEDIGNITITNQYTPETTAIKGAKIWNDYNNQDGKRPESITVNLLADGKKIDEKVVTEQTNWAYEFTDLPKYDQGQLINYTVSENEVEDYTTDVKGHDLVNNYTPSKTNVTVTKAWDDNHDQDGKRPVYIKVQLYADGEKMGDAITLSEANSWTYTWQDLDEKAEGNKIVYTVKEEGTQSEYEISVNDEDKGNIIITNTHKPEMTSIKGTKQWDDQNDQDGKRPESVTINLLANGTKVAEKVVTEKENWVYEFTDLPKYEEGQLIHYTVTENSVPNYTAHVNGHNLINSYTPKKTGITVTKAWDDHNNQDGKRPSRIKVQLYADNKKSGDAVVLSEANKWTYTWQDLDEKANGKEITYTVKEEGTPSGYELTVNDENSGNIILTNKYTPEVTAINGTKQWDDSQNQDGKRPDSITVNLLADGKKVAEKVVTEKDNWQYEFTNLPKYEEGQLINYTVTENDIDDYSTTKDGYDLINHYTPKKTSVTVTKAWEDHHNQDGKRPTHIRVQLYADGEKSGEAVALNEGNQWTHTWQDLDEKRDGQRIVYTVKEEGTPSDYEVIVNHDDIGNIMITNSYNPETTAVNGTKQWDDSQNQDGKRPESVTINLLANGKKVAEQTVTAENDWAYEFTNLPKYDSGNEIVYTVTENMTGDYTTEIKGNQLINHYTPKKTSVTVTKAWEDKYDQDGKRPSSIKVQLYADNKKSGEAITLSEANKWTHTWQDLDEKANGKEISYTVKEEGTPSGYELVVNDENSGNIILTNIYTPEVTAIKGTKQWDDSQNQDGKRPESITVNLLADGKKVAEKVVTEKDNWQYEFTNLPKYEDGELITYSVTEDDIDDYSTGKDGYDLINHYTPKKTSVTVTKAWEDHHNQDGKRPSHITVQLYADGKKSGDPVILNEGNQWTHTWQDLDEKTDGQRIVYTVKEEGTPSGYEVIVNNEDIGNIMLMNTYTPEVTSVKGKKMWNDEGDQDGKRANSITIHLLANGKKVAEKVVTEEDNWEYEFTNLPKYEDGQLIDYTVTENSEIDYSTDSNGHDLINNYTPGKTSVTVTKAWEDQQNQDGKRPTSIKVQLYADGKKFGDAITLSDANQWTHTWQNLDQKANGQEIKYTVKEEGTASGYEVVVNDDDTGNIILTNNYTPEITSVKGSKLWDDHENQDGKRPASVIVNLLADGKKVAEKTVTEDDNWEYEFTNLPKYENGQEIIYTITENQVPDYSTEINQFNLINSYTPKKTSVTVTKAWEDGQNQDGKRPNSINVQLYADGEKTGDAITLSEANQWTHTWQDLDEKANGQDIKYTVKEEGTPSGYEVVVNNENTGNIIVTNSYTPETTSINGTKTWDDAENQDGKRPESVTVNLLANGKKVTEQVVTEKDNWQYAFTNLPKYEEGQEIIYTVTENETLDYTTRIDGNNLINHYAPGKTSVTVTKAWEDAKDQDGKRPNSIKVQLYADGEKAGDVITLNEANKWTHTWQDLDEKANGQDIKYTVKEEGTPSGYEVVVNDKNSGNIILTNTYTPEITSIKGAKTWDDHNNQDGKRPDFITVNLLANGQKVAEKVISEEDNWAYEFNDLPKYEDGQLIDYTVTENSTNDYTTEIDGTNLINRYTPGKTSVTVTKSWEDSHNQDGKRPNSINVQLYADGEKSGEVITLNQANNWTYTWQDLAEKKSGKDIIYTVKEEGTPSGYEVVVNNENRGNIILTNNYTPETTSINGTKTWDDQNNQDGKRPESITVHLLADGKKTAQKVVTEEDNWQYEFTNLPKYEAGKIIQYQVVEDKVADYTVSYDGTTIINTYKPDKTSLSVAKAWDDDHDKDGIRPDSISVELYADGEKLGEVVTLNDDNQWMHVWSDLDKKKGAKDIVYEVKEVDVPDQYDATIVEKNGHVTITNTHTPKNVSQTKPNTNKPNSTGILPKAGESINRILSLIGIVCLVPVAAYVSTRKKDN